MQAKATLSTAAPVTQSQPDVPPATSQVQSAFSQLVEEFAADSTLTPPAAAPSALPSIKAAAAKVSSAPVDPLPALPLPDAGKQPELTNALPTSRKPDPKTSAAPPARDAAQPPVLPVEISVAVPIPPQPVVQKQASGAEPETKAAPVTSSIDEPHARVTLEPAPALEVRIHVPQQDTPMPQPQPTPVIVQPVPISQNESTPNQNTKDQCTDRDPSPQATPSRAAAHPDTTQPESDDHAAVPRAADPVPASPQTAPHQTATVDPTPVSSGAASTAPPTANVPAPAPVSANTPKPQPAPIAAPMQSTAPPDLPKAQPLRSVALEFTPDGASDIKVRLSERGGDVHISLHGTDPALAGRVREGVGDLIGSLSKAGYDAEAWTPSQGRQNQGREQEPRQPAQQSRHSQDAEEFSGMLPPSDQEIS